MLGPDEWDALTRDWAARLDDSPARRVLSAILDINSRLETMEELTKEALEHAGITRREAALKAARELVNGLPSEQPNERGYKDRAMRPQDRVQMELDIARYLLGQESLWAIGAQDRVARFRWSLRSWPAGGTGTRCLRRHERGCGRSITASRGQTLTAQL
jgi:hypothetical protein